MISQLDSVESSCDVVIYSLNSSAVLLDSESQLLSSRRCRSELSLCRVFIKLKSLRMKRSFHLEK